MAQFNTADVQHWEDFWGLIKKPGYTKIVNWLGGWMISRALIHSLVYIALLGVLSNLIPNLPLFAFNWLLGTAPLWAPVACFLGAWYMHLAYKHKEFLAKKHTALFELKIPKEIYKSPRAMEIALNQLHNTGGETTFVQRWWLGQVRAWYSLEIVSFGGQIHFYIWGWKELKQHIEISMYSQFPEVEVVEVEDYAQKFFFDPRTHIAWGCDWRLAPVMGGEENARPIKSYIDFELDKDPQEKNKVDPLSYILEFMSSIKPDEQIWVQLLIRGNSRDVVRTAPFTYKQRWDELHKKVIEDIKKEALQIPGVKPADAARPKEGEIFFEPNYTHRQLEMMRTVERHWSKRPFDFIARGIYITNAKSIRGSTIGALRLMWRPYANLWLSSFEPTRWSGIFDYPWQDFRNYRKTHVAKRLIDAYRRRSAFYAPWYTPYNIVTAETLASFFHFPSTGVPVSGLDRATISKGEPPNNLPK